ncbi:BNR repeat-containing protein [uncultured Draconibacterium sp.]|uniref:BNR repeat-containing protein n=1 Tax=uncultured Draconibacterium sp. TaxID=1573823 RepID=UPI0032608271
MKNCLNKILGILLLLIITTHSYSQTNAPESSFTKLKGEKALKEYIDEISLAINYYGRDDLKPYHQKLKTAYNKKQWDDNQINKEIARKDSLLYSIQLSPAKVIPTKIIRRDTVDLIETALKVGFSQAIQNGNQYIAYYDKDKNMCVASRKLNETSFRKAILNSKVGWDNHNSVKLALDNEGYIHVSGNMHNDTLKYWRSVKPYDASIFERIPRMAGGYEETVVTYPEFIKAQSGDFIFKYRYGYSGNGNDVYNIWDPGPKKWHKLLDHVLINGQGERSAYAKGPKFETDGYYHMYWVWRENGWDAATNHSFSYARSRDLIHWESASGNPINGSVLLETPGLLVDPSSYKTSNNGIINGAQSHTIDSKNRFVLFNMKYDSLGNSQFYAYRFNREANSWDEHLITKWLYRFDFSGPGSLEFLVNIISARNLGNGELGVTFKHVKYGIGEIILNEETLSPVDIRKVVSEYPKELSKVTIKGSFDPEIKVRLSKVGNYILRWETMGVNRDSKPNGPLPKPSALEVIEMSYE